MYEPMRELAFELLAGLIDIPRLRRINFGDASSTDELTLLLNEMPHSPEILVEFLTVFNGVVFYPDRGCFFNITEIIEKYHSMKEPVPHDDLPVFFGISSSGYLLALDTGGGKFPGQESILAIPEKHLLIGLCFQDDEAGTSHFHPEQYIIGTGFVTWLDSWIAELRREAELGLMGGFASSFPVSKS